MIFTSRILLLLLITFLATNLSAQTHQFGFVAKVGTAAKPERIQEQTGILEVVTKNVQWTKPGNMTMFGVVHRFSINKRLFLSGELLFRYANISTGNENTYISNGILAENDQTERIAESSIALPVKLEWAPFKKRRTSFGIGVGFSRVVGAEVATSYSRSSTFNPEYNYEFNYPKVGVASRDAPMEISFNAGIYHQLNQGTSIGIEIMAEPERRPYYVALPQDFLIDCYCDGYPYMDAPSLLSFTLSIRHLLIKDK